MGEDSRGHIEVAFAESNYDSLRKINFFSNLHSKGLGRSTESVKSVKILCVWFHTLICLVTRDWRTSGQLFSPGE